MAGTPERKTLLVSLGERRHPVAFISTEDLHRAHRALEEAIKSTFADLLSPSSQFCLQLRDDDWGEVFADLLDTQDIPNCSVVNVVRLDKNDTATSLVSDLHA